MSCIPAPTETFAQFFDRQGFKHFRARELAWMFSRVNKGVRNSEPHRDLWPNILPAIAALDALRAEVGAPITLSSTYRRIAYNRSVGSSDASQHVKFTAVDFAVQGMTPRAVFDVLRQSRDKGKWVGGLGLYRTFVHIDTRGRNATWGA